MSKKTRLDVYSRKFENPIVQTLKELDQSMLTQYSNYLITPSHVSRLNVSQPARLVKPLQWKDVQPFTFGDYQDSKRYSL